MVDPNLIPDVSEEQPVGSNGSGGSSGSGASSSRVLPRVEAGDVLASWDSFGSWKLRTSRLIRFYGAMTVEGVVAPEFKDQAIMILAARLSPDILLEGRDFGESFTDMWKWLNERHEKRSVKVTNFHYSLLIAIKMTAAESVEEYVVRADRSIQILQSAKFQFDMATIVRAIISGLHPHFAAMAAPMLFADSIKTVTAMRDGFESINIMGNVPRPVEYGNAAMGLSIEVPNSYKNYDCHTCGKMGHIARNCPGPPDCPPLPRTNDRSNNRNNQRGRGGGYGNGGYGNGGNGGYRNGGNRNNNQHNSGHGSRPETQTADMAAAGARNWAAAAQERVQFSPEELQLAREMLMLQGYVVTEGTVLKWLMDSGASKHMCKDRNKFTVLVPHCAEVEFGNGYRVRVYWKGTVVIRAIGGPLELTDVLYVPSLASNLFSVSRACKLGARCTFLEDGLGAYIEHSNKLVCTATFVNELYWLEELYLPTHTAAVADVHALPTLNTENKRTVEAVMWHRRLGHLGYETLARMCTLNLLPGCTLKAADFLQARRDTTCETCIETKHMGKPHTTLSTRVANEPCGRMFSDVTGNPSDGFFVTLLCEHTTWAASRALVHKSATEVLAFISDTVAMLERQTGFKLKRLRTDGGAEYDNALMRAWCASSGVIHELTSRDSPQQDGPGERLNRTVWDRVRPVMKDSGLPIIPFLAHAFQYATHIRNLTPSKGRDVTPHYAMFGTNVDASRLKVFGCTAWVFVPASMRERGKLAERSVKGTFVGLGLPLENPAYLIQLPTRIIQSSDVTFGDEAGPQLRSTVVQEQVVQGVQVATTVVREEQILPFSVPDFSFPRVSVPGLSTQESPLSGGAAGTCESTGSAGQSSGTSGTSDTTISPTTSVSDSKPWMRHADTAAQWQAFSEHIAADGNQEYGDDLSESSDSVRTDPMNMYDTVQEESSVRDDVSVSDLVDSSPVSHSAGGVSPEFESPDQVSLCQPRPGIPDVRHACACKPRIQAFLHS